LAGNIWVNSDEIPNNGIDDDANGYIDDRNGYDFGYNDPIPNDVNGHGTSCAGLVAAVQDNTIGVTGTAPFAKIMALKASTDDGYFYDSANIGCYMYAAGNGAKVLSCSYFSDRVSQAERDAIDYCWQRGILPVVAAGNANTVTPYYPGAYENVLAVGATDQSDNKAGFSNYGSWVDVASPGVSLRSTTAGGGYTNGFGGTSGATPQVAGIAALILGARPNLTNAQLRSILEDTATALATDWTNYGLVNAQKAVRVALGLEAQVAKTPVARYITPIVYGNRIGGGIRGNEVARLYGRGFQSPNTVEIKVGTTNLRILRQTRDWIDFELPIGSAPIEVSVNGSKLRTFTRRGIPDLLVRD
jgi:subtilisin family serine protease